MSKQLKTKTKEYIVNGDTYFPTVQNERSLILPSGVYETGVTMEGAPYLNPIQIVTDEIVDIPDYAINDIVNDIDLFWSDKVTAKFKEYKLTPSRGILAHGEPGTGKTIGLAKTAKLAMEKYNAVVLFNPEVGSLKQFLRLIKDIEPGRKVLVMFEEFDSILRGDESTLLSLLDGEIKVEDVVYLATTNYISRIPSRIKNRPSRFAKIVEFGIPNKEARRSFLEAKLHESDVHLLPALLDSSDGFVLDQLKDLIVSVACFGYDISESITKIKEMQADAQGVDDYNEEQAKSIFNTNKKRIVNPLRPIK
jgi:SpoVK/Ycf46/Vps4 family AAA+-type ATPase